MKKYLCLLLVLLGHNNSILNLTPTYTSFRLQGCNGQCTLNIRNSSI
jgi:hypothetical protein